MSTIDPIAELDARFVAARSEATAETLSERDPEYAYLKVRDLTDVKPPKTLDKTADAAVEARTGLERSQASKVLQATRGLRGEAERLQRQADAEAALGGVPLPEIAGGPDATKWLAEREAEALREKRIADDIRDLRRADYVAELGTGPAERWMGKVYETDIRFEVDPENTSLAEARRREAQADGIAMALFTLYQHACNWRGLPQATKTALRRAWLDERADWPEMPTVEAVEQKLREGVEDTPLAADIRRREAARAESKRLAKVTAQAAARARQGQSQEAETPENTEDPVEAAAS